MPCLLLETRYDVVQRPWPSAKVSGEWVSEVVVLHDVGERMHPTLETAVHERRHAGNGVDSIAADCEREEGSANVAGEEEMATHQRHAPRHQHGRLPS